MNIKRILSNFDYVLMGIIIVIFSLGIIAIASATGVTTYGITRQVQMQTFSFIFGLILIGLLQFINYEIVGEFYWWLYGIAVLLLLVIFIPGVGVIRNGSRSWIDLGPIDFQTSEVAKIAYIIFLAKFVEKMGGIKSIKDTIKAGITLLPILGLILKQPDLGSALVFVSATFGILLVNGLKYWQIGAGIGGVIAAIPLLYPRLEPHQRERIDAFLNPDDITLPGNYHVMQSKITIGSGQMYGRGLFKGDYHSLNYLPVQESDFIYAVFVEETGFVGGIFIIFLYMIFLLRLITLSNRVKDDFGSNIITGFAFMFGFQIIENIAMTLGKMPVTGITLPFFSYGSTSIVSSLLAIGIAESIYIRRKKGTFFN